MKLFKYEGYEVKVAPEALALKPFKKLWNRDKSKDKERAMMEFGFLYFYCDPKSDYQYIKDEEDRLEEIKKGQGLSKDWKPDATLQAAIEFYNSFDSTPAILLRVAREGVDKVQRILEKISTDNIEDDPKKAVSVAKEYLTALKMVPQVAAMIQEAEKAINVEEEYGEARGAVEKAMFDDGLDDVADWVNQQK